MSYRSYVIVNQIIDSFQHYYTVQPTSLTFMQPYDMESIYRHVKIEGKYKNDIWLYDKKKIEG